MSTGLMFFTAQKWRLVSRVAWAAVALAMVFGAGCLRPGCVNKVRDVMASPDGRMKLVVFSRECGGTESNLQASVLEAAERLPEKGANAVVVDDGDVEFSWKPDGGVLVAYKRGARFYKQEEYVRGVSLEYRPGTD